MKRQSIIVLIMVTLSVANAGPYPSGNVFNRQPLDMTLDGVVNDLTYGSRLGEYVILGAKEGFITGVQWYGYYENGNFAPTVGDTVDFYVAIDMAANDNDPMGHYYMNEMVAATVLSSMGTNGRTIYEFGTQSFTPISISDIIFLQNGERDVWLSIAECDTGSDLVVDPWLWSRSSYAGGALWDFSVGQKSYISSDLAFTLTGVVPLPPALLLGAIGLCVAGLKLRKYA
jgi:hypothetical protein